MANNNEHKFPIYTNNLKIEIDRRNVDSKFDIYQVGTTDLFHNKNVLDLPSKKIKARSVAYYRSNRWFVMFSKDSVNFEELKNAILKIDDSSTVNKVDLFDEEFESKTSIRDIELAQLLVNSLKNRTNKLFAYNNILGQLYYDTHLKQNTKSLEFLNLRFYGHDNVIALEANTETFSEVESLKKYGKPKAEPKYILDEETGEFRRILKEDQNQGARCFDKGALSNKGKRKTFLDFSSDVKFRESKTGIIASFFADVKENLSDYITISQIPLYDYNDCSEIRIDYENKNYAQFIKEKGICIVDTVKSTASKQMQEKMAEFLTSKYKIEKISDVRENGKYIIEIIHNKESDFYAKKENLIQPSLFPEDNKPEDQHNLFNENEIIQHITVEDSSERVEKVLKDVMHNIVQELIIKGNVVDKQISLVNWNEPKEWAFVKCGKGKWNGQKKCYNFNYYKMTVSPSGKLDFEIFDDREYPDTEEWEVISKIFENYNKGKKNQYSNIECVVYSSIDEINVIYKTKQFTLPNVEKFAKTISISDGKRTIAKVDLKSYLDEFISIHDLLEEDGDLKDLINNIQKIPGEKISYKDLLISYDSENKKHSLIKRKQVKAFVKWLSERTAEYDEPIILHAQIKSGPNLHKHFNSLMGIKSLRMGGKFKYFVGKKDSALKMSLPNSCIIRDVIPWDKDGENENGKILFDELKHMLLVEFVRNGQYTVIPFPMKYLNEYIRICEKDMDFEND